MATQLTYNGVDYWIEQDSMIATQLTNLAIAGQSGLLWFETTAGYLGFHFTPSIPYTIQQNL